MLGNFITIKELKYIVDVEEMQQTVALRFLIENKKTTRGGIEEPNRINIDNLIHLLFKHGLEVTDAT